MDFVSVHEVHAIGEVIRIFLFFNIFVRLLLKKRKYDSRIERYTDNETVQSSSNCPIRPNLE